MVIQTLISDSSGMGRDLRLCIHKKLAAAAEPDSPDQSLIPESQRFTDYKRGESTLGYLKGFKKSTSLDN